MVYLSSQSKALHGSLYRYIYISLVRTFRLVDAFSEILEVTASLLEGPTTAAQRSEKRKKKKRQKWEVKKGLICKHARAKIQT